MDEDDDGENGDVDSNTPQVLIGKRGGFLASDDFLHAWVSPCARAVGDGRRG